MKFYSKLRAIQRKNNSLLCVGLDPDVRRIPGHLLSQKDAVVEFCRCIIAQTSDLVCAYKLNLAFFETLGEAGWSTIHRVLELVPPEVVTIGDGKRGDIGNTAEMYARALFSDFKFDAATVHPYMGQDSVQPFVTDRDHGAFILALTSNPGARDFQSLKVKGKPLYEHVIARAKKWNSNGNIGIVVGATRAVQLRDIRHLIPSVPLLVPGVGAQGGDLRAAVRYGCDADGEMAIINASRSILYASPGADFAEAARRSAMTMRDEMNTYREQYF
jgi:orotidine-5'-phosphate decarboxylase